MSAMSTMLRKLLCLDELVVELLLLKASTRKLLLLDELDVDDNVKLDVGDVAENCSS